MAVSTLQATKTNAKDIERVLGSLDLGYQLEEVLEDAEALLEAIGALGAFDHLPADESLHSAHNAGQRLLGIIEDRVREIGKDERRGRWSLSMRTVRDLAGISGEVND